MFFFHSIKNSCHSSRTLPWMSYFLWDTQLPLSEFSRAELSLKIVLQNGHTRAQFKSKLFEILGLVELHDFVFVIIFFIRENKQNNSDETMLLSVFVLSFVYRSTRQSFREHRQEIPAVLSLKASFVYESIHIRSHISQANTMHFALHIHGAIKMPL